MNSAHRGEEMAALYRRHVSMVYQICLMLMKNVPDAEDATQNVFRKAMEQDRPFRDPEHEKAWLIVTARNECRDQLKHWWRRNDHLDDYSETLKAQEEPAEIDEVMKAICGLPDKYKTVIYLFYFEGYSCVEISKIVGKPQSTVRNHLHEARQSLKQRLGDDFDEK